MGHSSEPEQTSQGKRWIANVRPARMSIDGLLEGNFHLDVWERHTEFVTVVAYEADLDPEDREKLAAIGLRMATLMRNVHQKIYVPQQASQLYPAAGDTTDWAYGKHSIPAITIELRPDSHALGGFILPPDQIKPTFDEMLPATMEFIRTIFG